MGKRMLVFDYKKCEREFFETQNLEEYDISFFEGSLNEKTLKNVALDDLDNTEIINLFINSRVNKEVLEAFKNLKIIATRSTGFNHINLEECVEHNVAVTNVSDYGAVTVVQFTFGVIIALVRKIIPALFDMKKLENNYEEYIGHDLNALTIGVIGTGVIGSNVCKVASALGMKILAYDIKQNEKVAEKYNAEYVRFDELIKNSDIITVHIPYNDENYHMFSHREFELMKDNAYFINTSRGELVNTYALYNALINKRLQGCALDVGECEYFSFDMTNFLQKIPETTHNCLGRALVIQKMIELPNVIITPHIAHSTTEAIETILETTMENIKSFYEGKKLNRIV